MNGLNKFYYYLFLIILYSLFLSPKFKIYKYNIQLYDLFLPIIFISIIILYIKNKAIIKIFTSFKDNPLWLYFLYFFVYIFSIVFSSKYTFNSITESYKFIRFVTFFTFFTILLKYSDNSFKKIDFHLVNIFNILVVFNILHYFNIFNFNNYIEPLYSSGPHLEFFGLNTRGEFDTKRLLGTIGNPNLNALIFLFFFFYFFNRLLNTRKKIYFLFQIFSLTLTFLCQSRTAFIAMFIALIVFILLNRLHLKKILLVLIISFLANGILLLFISHIDSNYKTMYYIKRTNFESKAIEKREKVWSLLLEKVKDRPVLGHSVDKSFFYKNKIYPESEYIYVLYKYGIVGLLVFLSFYLFPVYKILTTTIYYEKIPFFIYFIICYVSSITNIPFDDFNLNIFYSLILSLFII